MAIQRLDPQQLSMTPTEAGELLLRINNGDLQALEDIKKKWKFKNVEDIIRFAIAILIKAETPKVTVTQGGNPVSFSPAGSLLDNDNTT